MSVILHDRVHAMLFIPLYKINAGDVCTHICGSTTPAFIMAQHTNVKDTPHTCGEVMDERHPYFTPITADRRT